MKPRILVIAGPTASGKTTAAIRAASLLDAEIVSADARQIYRDLDIGTAKPSREERAAVPHHFIDHVGLERTYTAGEYFREASTRILEIFGRGKRVVVCGGSGLYVNVLINGIFEGPYIPPAVRAALRKEFQEGGPDTLFEELLARDPEAARWVPKTNSPRLLRALEVCRVADAPYSRLRGELMPSVPYDSILVGLRWNRAALYERIDTRVDAMIAEGFLEEAKGLLERGEAPDGVTFNTVGYKEALAYLKGNLELEPMIARMKQHTRNYAKRQLTWFRRETRMQWYDVKSSDEVIVAAEQMAGRFLSLADQT